MTTLIFGLAYWIFDIDDDLQFIFPIFALLDGFLLTGLIKIAYDLK